MTGRLKIVVTLVALLALGGAAVASGAPSGGAAPGVLTLPDGTPVQIRLGNPLQRASSDGIALATRATALLRGRVRIAGRAGPHTGTVTIERDDPTAGWVAVASAAVAADGSFVALWRPNRLGSVALRAVAGAASAGSAGDDASAPQLSVTVYRPGVASWYGPTVPDQTTACGVPLEQWTLGVAHRTLPCGTLVSLYYKGRSIVVPVIDRGPYVAGRSWDLTRQTFLALGGEGGLIRVGALPLLPATPPAAAPARR